MGVDEQGVDAGVDKGVDESVTKGMDEGVTTGMDEGVTKGMDEAGTLMEEHPKAEEWCSRQPQAGAQQGG